MSDEYQALPQYHPPQGVRMATAEEQKPLVKMISKMMTSKLAKLPHPKGKIAPQSVKISHKKKSKQVIYY